MALPAFLSDLTAALSAEPLCQRLLLASIEFVALAGLTAGLIRIARIRSARILCLLWAIVLLKPIVALTVGSPVPLARVPEPAPLAEQAGWTLGLNESDDAAWLGLPNSPVYGAAVETTPDGASGLAAPPPPPITPVETPGPWLTFETLPMLLLAVWLIGIIVFLLAHRAARARLYGIVRAAGPASSEVRQRYGHLAGRLRVKRLPALAVTDRLESPALVGLWRPTILLPAWLARNAGSAQLDWAMRHELTHWRWGDPASILLRDAAAILFWFHPAAWWAGRRLTESMELACDRAIVHDAADASDYAEELFRILQNLRDRRRPAVAGGLFATRTQVGKRIAALLDGSTVRAPQLTALSAFGVIVLAAASLAVGLATATPKDVTEDGQRILQFPKSRSLGSLFVQDERVVRNIETFFFWTECNDEWDYLAEATGDVVIPAGKRVHLHVAPSAAKYLSSLAKLGPDDLYALTIAHMPVDDASMRYLDHLTGLRFLSLDGTRIGARGLKRLQKLESLERLRLPDGVTDESIVAVTGLQSLKGLYFLSSRLTDAGVAQLTELTSLEELSIGNQARDATGNLVPGTTRMSEAALAPLARFPRLRYLMLWGEFTNNSLAPLGSFSSLRILNLNNTTITGDGLKHLSSLTKLECLALYNTKVTERGFVHLVPLRSLKKLALPSNFNLFNFAKNPPYGDDGMEVLSRIQTLEHLTMKADGLSDRGLAALGRLSRLEVLEIPSIAHRDPDNYLHRYTVAGFRELAKLRALRELQIGNIGTDDAAMPYIAQLANLRKLDLFGCPITNEGLAKLAALKSLEHVSTGPASDVTLSGLNCLSALPCLTRLEARVEPDERSLDIAGLTHLKSLLLVATTASTVRDNDLACLAALEELDELSIACPGGVGAISDAGVAHLAGLTSLERLFIAGPRLTDQGLAVVANLRSLNTLTLAGSFTDAGLEHLHGLQRLTRLTIQSSQDLSDKAIAHLRKSLPNVRNFSVDDNCALANDAAGPDKAPKVGDVAPLFNQNSLDGKPIALADYRGKVVLLYFWATWCKPCVASMPTMKDFQKDLSRFDDFVMISLSMDDNDGTLKQFVTQHALSWPQVRIGLSSRIAADYGVNGAPEYCLIGRDGRILSTDKDLRTLHAAATKALQAR